MHHLPRCSQDRLLLSSGNEHGRRNQTVFGITLIRWKARVTFLFEQKPARENTTKIERRLLGIVCRRKNAGSGIRSGIPFASGISLTRVSQCKRIDAPVKGFSILPMMPSAGKINFSLVKFPFAHSAFLCPCHVICIVRFHLA